MFVKSRAQLILSPFGEFNLLHFVTVRKSPASSFSATNVRSVCFISFGIYTKKLPMVLTDTAHQTPSLTSQYVRLVKAGWCTKASESDQETLHLQTVLEDLIPGS